MRLGCQATAHRILSPTKLIFYAPFNTHAKLAEERAAMHRLPGHPTSPLFERRVMLSSGYIPLNADYDPPASCSPELLHDPYTKKMCALLGSNRPTSCFFKLP